MHFPQFVILAIPLHSPHSPSHPHRTPRRTPKDARLLRSRPRSSLAIMCGIPRLHPQVPSSILVSLPDQLLYVYRNGVRIGRSTVSTGKPGKSTPTGVFTVLQKKVRHESSIYKGAQMPHMQRLTWTGVAMHAGNLPGYPASAGCVRLPVDFAANLYSVTTIGTTVIIADNRSAPKETVKPGLLFSSNTGTAARAFKWTPEKAPKGPVSVIISGADRAADVYRQLSRAIDFDRLDLAAVTMHVDSDWTTTNFAILNRGKGAG